MLTHLSNAICHVEKIPNKRNKKKNIKRKKKNIITKKGMWITKSIATKIVFFMFVKCTKCKKNTNYYFCILKSENSY